MKNALWIVLALLAGLVLGALGPRADLRTARERIAELEKAARRPRSSGAAVSGITSMLRIPDEAAARTNAAPPEPAADEPHGSVSFEASISSTGVATSVAEAGDQAERDSMEDRIRTAADLWNTRASIARNSFVSNVTTSDEQAIMFDVLVTAMNLRLSNSIRTWVDYVKETGEMTPETGVRMMNELSQALVITYDELDGRMPSDWRDAAGEEFEVFSFIDPQVAMPLAEIEGAMQQSERRRDRRWRHEREP